MEDFAQLPQSIRTILVDDRFEEDGFSLQEDFKLNDSQIVSYHKILRDIIFKRRKTTDLPEMLAEMPEVQNMDLRSFGLAIAIRRLWPLQSYLGEVDSLIRRLGGKVPDHIPTFTSDSVNEHEENRAAGWVNTTARGFMSRSKNFGELYITQKPIKDDDDRLKPPSASNWLLDYIHTMGAGNASSLKRSQYLGKSRNTLILNDAEKANLLNFLLSYEEDTPMYWHVAEGQYLLVEDELPESERVLRSAQNTSQQLGELISYYQKIQTNFEALFADKARGLEIEIGSDTKKLHDIIWESLGLGESERCLAALALLITSHGFTDMLKNDRRYQGIIARDIEAKYGVETKNMWDRDMASAVTLTIFWRLILVNKLGIEEGRAAIIADLFTKKLGQKLSPLYLDLKKGKFFFRELVLKDRILQFAQQL